MLIIYYAAKGYREKGEGFTVGSCKSLARYAQQSFHGRGGLREWLVYHHEGLRLRSGLA